MTGSRHFFTVDVEEYFQVSAFESVVPRASWAERESRVERGVDRVLDLLARHDARGTFFTLGWIAERHRKMLRRIQAAGHEIASHGWGHRRVTTLTPAQFRESVRRSRAVLEDACGCPVIGYRAPSFSIVPGREWALDVLLDEGYRYDSSLFPIRRPGYGYAGGQRDPHWITRDAGRLAEFPPATVRAAGLTLPAAGGAYLRIFPPGLVRRGLREAAGRGSSGTLYIHPWEVDPGQPRLDAPLSSRLRHYTGLHRTVPRLEGLLREFRFTTLADGLAELEGRLVAA